MDGDRPGPSVASNESAPAIGGWRYVSEGDRDLRLDLLRGYLIFAMLVDHIAGGSWLHAVTGGDRFVVSAAEGFMLISGLVMGMVYQKVIRRDGLCAALRKVLLRAVKLYILHVALTLGFATASNLAGAFWSAPVEDRAAFVVGVLTLRETYYLTDIVHLYTMLVLSAPVALLLLARGRGSLVLLASGLLWAVYQQFPYELASITANVAFPAAAWQVFFFGGLVLGYHRGRVWALLGRIPRVLAAPLLGCAALALIAQHISGGTLFLTDGLVGQSHDEIFYKWDVRPGRLIAVAIFFPLAYLLVSAAWRPLRVGLGWILLPLGQNSLLAYSMHLPAVLMAATLLPLIPGFDETDPRMNGLAQLAGVALVWGSVKGSALLSQALRSRLRPRGDGHEESRAPRCGAGIADSARIGPIGR